MVCVGEIIEFFIDYLFFQTKCRRKFENCNISWNMALGSDSIKRSSTKCLSDAVIKTKLQNDSTY